MVSKSTSRDIRRHLQQVSEEFQIPESDIEIFEQREIPAFDFKGNILYKSEDEIYTAPSRSLNVSPVNIFLVLDGNGGN